jgi:predicted  nucleic acid-binding Zn-ribbon protein
MPPFHAQLKELRSECARYRQRLRDAEAEAKEARIVANHLQTSNERLQAEVTRLKAEIAKERCWPPEALAFGREGSLR